MKKLLAAIILVFSSRMAWAIPDVTAISGDFRDNGIVTVGGTGFEAKSTGESKPLLWAPFDTDINPSTYGVRVVWAQNQNMEWIAGEGYSGGVAKADDDTGNWTLRIDYQYFTTDSQKVFVFRRNKINFDVYVTTEQNWKIWRTWPGPGAVGYPNMYISWNSNAWTVENCSGCGFSGGFNPNAGDTADSWYAEEIIFQASSNATTKDGVGTYRTNGVTRVSKALQTRDADTPDTMQSMFVCHGQVANKGSWDPPWSTSNRFWCDDVYVDTTWQRVMIGDASTWANVRKMGIVVPSGWTSTSVTGRMEISSSDFPPGTTAYAYVFDTSGTPNTNGRSFVMGGSVAANPPRIDTVTPSTGSHAGGETVTIDGGDFSTSPSVKFGNNFSASVTRVSASRLTAVVPAPTTAGVAVDVTVINDSDGQDDVAPDAYTYGATPPITPERDPDPRESGEAFPGGR